MTNAELIAELQRMPGHAPACVHVYPDPESSVGLWLPITRVRLGNLQNANFGGNIIELHAD